MGIDIAKMKKKLKQSESDGGSSDTVRWKPDLNSNHRLRVLLPKDGSGDPFKQFHIHYGIGEKHPFLCPNRNFNNECAVCQLGSELWQEGEEKESQHHMELAKDLWPSDRYFSPVVEIKKGSDEIIEGPAWYGYSKTVYQEFLKYITDDEYNPFTNAEDGHDVKLEYTKGKDDKYPSTSIDLAPMPSPITEDKEKMMSLYDEIPDIDEVVSEISEEELQQALNEHVEQIEKEMNGTEDLEKYGDEGEPEDDVEEAFNEIKGIG